MKKLIRRFWEWLNGPVDIKLPKFECKHDWYDVAESNSRPSDTVYKCRKCGTIGFYNGPE